MRDYNKVSPRLWHSNKFTKLSKEAKLLYVYLITSPHCNSLGCYTLPIAYMNADCGFNVINALEEIKASGMVQYNENEHMLYVVNFIRFNPPTNTKHAMKMVSEAKSIHVPEYRKMVMEEIQGECSGKNWDGVDSLFSKEQYPTDSLSIHKTRPNQTRQDKTVGVLPSADGWSVRGVLRETALASAKANAPGWDIYHLMEVYDKAIADGSRPPPANANLAFPAWCAKYTKGKRP